MAEVTLQSQPKGTLIELFFETDEPDERDALFEAIVDDNNEQSRAFLAAVMLEDEDPFMRVAAAAKLLPLDRERALGRLLEVLQAGGDALLFEEALQSLVEHPDEALFDTLNSIIGDHSRDVTERRLAWVAMDQLDEGRAVSLCLQQLHVMGNADALLRMPLELLSTMMGILVRQEQPSDAQCVERLAALVPRRPSHPDDADDHELLRELFEETLALLAVDPNE